MTEEQRRENSVPSQKGPISQHSNTGIKVFFFSLDPSIKEKCLQQFCLLSQNIEVINVELGGHQPIIDTVSYCSIKNVPTKSCAILNKAGKH